jgi:hypothetical protein
VFFVLYFIKENPSVEGPMKRSLYGGVSCCGGMTPAKSRIKSNNIAEMEVYSTALSKLL